MNGFDEFLYFHPLSITGRLAERAPKQRPRKVRKPRHMLPERRVLFRRWQPLRVGT